MKVIPCRFEVGLNRPRRRAIYRRPEEARGLEFWRKDPSEAVIEDSLMLYDRFNDEVERLFKELERRYCRFLVLDLHSYFGTPSARWPSRKKFLHG